VLALQLFLALDGTVMLLLGASMDELRASEEQRRRIGHQLLRSEEEERRRIARDLHDSTAQELYAATLMLETVSREQGAPREATLLEARDLIRRATNEVRTVSYLLHPPLLDEGGLRLATENFVAGFVKRTGIEVDVDFSAAVTPLPKEVELTFFRVIQEALTNISRHSGAKRARIEFEYVPAIGGDRVALTVQDFGKGITGLRGASIRIDSARRAPFAVGVGLRSLSERMSQIGGHLEVSSRAGSTIVRATAPCSPAATPEAAAPDTAAGAAEKPIRRPFAGDQV
jgi:signal transduction histidine kinase